MKRNIQLSVAALLITMAACGLLSFPLDRFLSNNAAGLQSPFLFGAVVFSLSVALVLFIDGLIAKDENFRSRLERYQPLPVLGAASWMLLISIVAGFLFAAGQSGIPLSGWIAGVMPQLTPTAAAAAPDEPPIIGDEEIDTAAVSLVSERLISNSFGLTANSLRTLRNPFGEGVFVYEPETRFNGLKRYFIWLVIDDQAYALNVPSKAVAPMLPWLKDAPAGFLERSGLDPNDSTEVLDLIWDGV